jgi:hypothetical protein
MLLWMRRNDYFFVSYFRYFFVEKFW